MLFQSLCEAGVEWDEPLTGSVESIDLRFAESKDCYDSKILCSHEMQSSRIQ